jgi:transglutaminase-like putative cysteine protease
MPHVQVVHKTEYRYNTPVTLMQHRLMLRPRDSHDLGLLNAVLSITPPPEQTRWAHDVFGNSIALLNFGKTTTKLLRIVSELDLRHYPTRLDLSVDPGAETYPFSYAPEELPDLAHMIVTYQTDPDKDVQAWARKFLSDTGATPTLEMLVAMTQAIKADFIYEAREHEGTNLPGATLETGRGACRDFALLMMEAVRSLGLAARFISGYLYDDALAETSAASGADPVIGGGSTHAWCAVYIPGAGWVEFDPTNGLIAGRNLIRVAVARTPGQALPVAGGFMGTKTAFAGLTVDVQVTVGDAPPLAV